MRKHNLEMNTLKFNLHINEREIEAHRSEVQGGLAHCPIKKVKSKLPIKSFHFPRGEGVKSEVQVVLEKFSFKGGEEVNRLCQI